MCDSRKDSPISSPDMKSVEKLAPEKYFNITMTILYLGGMYPISSDRSFVPRLLYSIYFWCFYIVIVVFNPISKTIALLYQTNLDDFTENLSYVINHTIGVFKIALFMIKRKDLMRLVETMEGQKFRHQDCGRTFSANRLVREAVWTSQAVFYCIYSFGAMCIILNSILKAITERSETQEISDLNHTESATTIPRIYRTLPFHGWYPFTTETSPNYELTFVYQTVAIFTASQVITALDLLVFSFMIHIKVQLRILSHNLRFIRSHAKNRRINASASHGVANDSVIIPDETSEQFTKTIELELEKNVAHHQAIIELSKDLESVFTYQLLLQFLCSLFSACPLLWQVSSTPVVSAKFASMLSYLGITAVQLFIYCWFGNEVMLESLSIAEAAWDSKWYEIPSRRYSHGISMIIQRSQKVIMITAGRFIGLTLETFMTISRAAYSSVAVLKKMDD